MFEKPALITFITAGDPNVRATLDFLLVLDRYADAIELGIPFSDPMADGRAIQKANVRALKAGTRVKDVFRIVSDFREHSETPLVLMTYFNPVYALGIDRFVSEAKKAGADGMIVVDLPIEESGEYLKACKKHSMGTIFLVAPNTPEKRIRELDNASTAFVYLISTYGTTGAREQISSEAFELVERAKSVCKNPVAVGFGVSKAEHLKQLFDAGADGVVVGSALVEVIERFGENACDELERKLKTLKKFDVRSTP